MERKKVYAEVTATIYFETDSPWDETKKLVDLFLARRGIEQLGDVYYADSKRNRKITSFRVRYRVHGGWKSDFARKLTIDALDTQVQLLNLDITIVRKEIPGECPRKDCEPCAVALGLIIKRFREDSGLDHKPKSPIIELDIPAPTPQREPVGSGRRWHGFKIRRNND